MDLVSGTSAIDGLRRATSDALLKFQWLFATPGSTVAGSRAAHEAKISDDREALRVAYELGCNAGSVGESYLRAVIALTDANSPSVFAAFAAGRAALEQFALTNWRLDPGIEPSLRVARCWGSRWASMEQAERFAEDLGSADFSAAVRDQQLSLVVEAQDRNMTVGTRGPTDIITGIGIQQPSWTGLWEEAWSFGVGYRFHSAVVHGQMWATMRVGGRIREGWDGTASHAMVEQDIKPDAIELVLRHGFYGYLSALRCASVLFSDDPSYVDRQADAILAAMVCRAAGPESR